MVEIEDDEESDETEKDERTSADRGEEYRLKHNRNRREHHGPESLASSDLNNIADLNTSIYSKRSRKNLLEPDMSVESEEVVGSVFDEEYVKRSDFEVKRLINSLKDDTSFNSRVKQLNEDENNNKLEEE